MHACFHLYLHILVLKWKGKYIIRVCRPFNTKENNDFLIPASPASIFGQERRRRRTNEDSPFYLSAALQQLLFSMEAGLARSSSLAIAAAPPPSLAPSQMKPLASATAATAQPGVTTAEAARAKARPTRATATGKRAIIFSHDRRAVSSSSPRFSVLLLLLLLELCSQCMALKSTQQPVELVVLRCKIK